MKKWKSINSLFLIIIFLCSLLIAIGVGYSNGQYICFALYNKDSGKIQDAKFLSIDENERARLKREAGLEAALLFDSIYGGKASLKDMKEVQEMTEKMTEAFIEMGQATEVFSTINFPPDKVLFLSGVIGMIFWFLISIFSLVMLRNILIKVLSYSHKYSKIASNFSYIGPISYLVKAYQIIRKIIITLGARCQPLKRSES
jgi:hypothetical protein